ncbi:hypothetical protein [Inhella gelatinilytica]|uniref:Uncharacterized protein n=1 Tax=Inhella gelatinilytica TaxID=2795030 RepID=A0A931IWB0_9BURK|nr:hypothetical protein [Inhella gelatinilytica]MBH9553107.1 hypothetical protein [Inhella gelatinilytica]
MKDRPVGKEFPQGVPASSWISATPSYTTRLPELAYPFERLPDVYVSESTILKIGADRRCLAFLWCYLDRRFINPHTRFNPASLSPARVDALPQVIGRLAKHFRFKNARAATIYQSLTCLAALLTWADQAEHQGRYEAVLSNDKLALEALKGYHRHLRQRLQTHQISYRTAAYADQEAIALMSEIHDRVYLDDIEPLPDLSGGGTKPPPDALVGTFMSTLQAAFDSVVAMDLGAEPREATTPTEGSRFLRTSSTDDSCQVAVPLAYGATHLMELACMAFAGLCIGDSGANLAQIQAFEEPEGIDAQLDDPDRVSLTHRVIKFRAGGKPVPVQLSSTTFTRLRNYLCLRQALLARLDCPDRANLFVQGQFEYAPGRRGKTHLVGLRALHHDFLDDLRKRFSAFRIDLPKATLRQLRAFKQQHLVRKYSVKVAADLMGHSIQTAIRAYSNAQEDVRRSDLGGFLSSLTDRVCSTATPRSDLQIVQIPAGECRGHLKPEPMQANPVVAPDCKKTEGCFFCNKYLVHAHEADALKLMSCRHVLSRLVHLQGDSLAADRVYGAVTDRIDALLAEIQRMAPQAHAAALAQVQRGELSRYWATKLQQLHLLGVLGPNPSPQNPS